MNSSVVDRESDSTNSPISREAQTSALQNRRPRLHRLLGVLVLFTLQAPPAGADGLVHQLPADGSWARFEVTGEGRGPNGELQVTMRGTITIKSVGQDSADGKVCRWIEVETAIEGERNGQKEKETETIKLLVPEELLVTGQDPRNHVVRAFKRNRGGKVRELEVKGKDAQAIQSLDEFFHGPFADSKKSEAVELIAPAGTFRCTRIDGTESLQRGDSDVAIEAQTWLSDDVPFGVAGYRYAKSYSRGGASLGGRWMELKIAKTGTNAKREP